jgi:basic amino acid/polyamine antiporter, APA family
MTSLDNTTSTPSTGVFRRQASGVVRAMSPVDGAFYGYLSATGIYGLVFFFFLGPALFPKANVWLANIGTFVLWLFVYGVYAILASSMPRSGGDYVFLSRILRPGIGFVVVFVGFIVWQFYFAYFTASALINIALAPMFSMIGVSSGSHGWISVANFITKPEVRAPLVVLVIILAGWAMVSGMAFFVKLQRYFMMPGAIIGLLMIIVALLFTSRSGFIGHFDAFQRSVGGLSATQMVAKARALGYHASHGYTFGQTFGYSCLLSYQYFSIIWIAELFGEVKSAQRVRKVFGMFAGAAALLCVTFTVGTAWAYAHFGRQFINAFAWMATNQSSVLGGDWGFRGAPTVFYLPFLSAGFGIVLFLCFIGPLSQSCFNCILGVSRFSLAMSIDRVLPESLGRVNSKGVPHIAIWGSTAIAVAIAGFTEWRPNVAQFVFWASVCSLGAVLCAVIAGLVLPFRRPRIYEVAPGRASVLGLPLVTLLGIAGGLFLLATVVYILTDNGAFGLWEAGGARTGLISVGCAIALAIAWFVGINSYQRRRGVDVAAAFTELPPD